VDGIELRSLRRDTQRGPGEVRHMECGSGAERGYARIQYFTDCVQPHLRRKGYTANYLRGAARVPTSAPLAAVWAARTGISYQTAYTRIMRAKDNAYRACRRLP